MRTLAVAAGLLLGLCGAATGQGFGLSTGDAPRYPANPQYQYPYPTNDARAQRRQKCPQGHVLDRGRCKPARPVALPF